MVPRLPLNSVTLGPPAAEEQRPDSPDSVKSEPQQDSHRMKEENSEDREMSVDGAPETVEEDASENISKDSTHAELPGTINQTDDKNENTEGKSLGGQTDDADLHKPKDVETDSDINGSSVQKSNEHQQPKSDTTNGKKQKGSSAPPTPKRTSPKRKLKTFEHKSIANTPNFASLSVETIREKSEEGQEQFVTWLMELGFLCQDPPICRTCDTGLALQPCDDQDAFVWDCPNKTVSTIGS